MERRFKMALAALLGTYLLGGVGYKILSPETSWMDCVYMSVITVASVGFTEIVDITHHPAARVYTMALILFGVSVNVYAVAVVTAYIVEGDLTRYFWKRRMNRMIGKLNNHFIVCGSGDTAMRVIEELARTFRSFVVIDSDPAVVERLQAFKDAAVIQGDPDDEALLESAGVRRAAAAALALKSDRDNLVAALSIRNLNPNIRIVVEESEPGMAGRFRRAGADAIINSANIGGLRLVSEMIRPSVVSFLDQMLRDPHATYRVEEIRIHDGSAWENRPLRDVPIHSEYSLIVAAAREKPNGEFVYNPAGSWNLHAGQTLIVLGDATNIKRARDAAEAGTA